MVDNNLTDNDDAAWQEAVKGIKPLNSSKVVSSPKKKSPPSKAKDINVPLKIYQHDLSLGTTADIDRSTMRRFKREEFAVEAKLDLHGFTENKAYEAVNRFITSSYLAGKRCVLIVTGKGLPHQDEDIFAPKGVLKDRVPQWLNQDNLKQLILSYIHPSPRLGGNGALYILLRRKRS